MAVVIETTVGDITVDLFLDERPKACLNFLKLCKLKYYNFNLFHTIEHGFIAQTGDPTGSGDGGESIWGVLEGPTKRFFKAEFLPKIRHTDPGLLSMVSLGDNLIGSQFFLTLGADLNSLDDQHCVIGQVTEGLEILHHLNDAICDNTHRPYQDIRITHTVVLDDPFENPRGFRAPSRSPSPSAERLQGGRIGADEDIDDTAGKTEEEIHEMMQERESKARATILEIVGDLPDADVAPPENVLFVCKLNPVTNDDDLEIIFSRFGKVKGCEVIRDRTSGDSLQYAFVEFEDSKACENAYFKMDNVLIDDRRIHVDFSQSVAKVQWKGKGRGLVWKDGNKTNRLNFNDLKGKNGSEMDKNRLERQPNRRAEHRNPSDRRHSKSPKSYNESRNNRSEVFQNRRRYPQVSRSKSRERKRSRSRSRGRSDRGKRIVSRSSSREKVSRVRRLASRSRSRSGNTSSRRRRSRSRSTNRTNRFTTRHDERNINTNYRNESYNSNQRSKDRFRSVDVNRYSRKSSPPAAVKRKSSSRDRTSHKNKKSRRSTSSSDTDSSPVRRKPKKSKRKKKKSKKSKKVSS
ncbi:Peptidyl-prolyl cis-trans isomerase sig-7 [Pseudolycoriella hygida]|uniref:Peptidyl-prolyl cis-trans isomerase n=1 Tax=Pseudolycoriella hygida TaxID=35572 RepID=A0A9Q0MLN7_9DIPT|nr:Peptidyl-prolyl cis-trans isomerase sig-7 [Pseudolycoriella hygida]